MRKHSLTEVQETSGVCLESLVHLKVVEQWEALVEIAGGGRFNKRDIREWDQHVGSISQ
jgi:hypothetical protein